jgi:histidinol phosphatase-like enzyme
VSVDVRPFVREPERGEARALILDFDELVGGEAPALRPDDVVIDSARREILTRWTAEGWRVFVHAWRPQVAREQTTIQDVDACFTKLRELVGVDVDVACCPHDAGPPVCWCRKPIPGSVLEFAMRRGVALTGSIVVAASAADRTMAERIGARVESTASFFS